MTPSVKARIKYKISADSDSPPHDSSLDSD
jgi:hypothetical protein